MMLTSAQVAEQLGLSISTVRQWRKKSRQQGPPYLTLGRNLVRYDSDELAAWVARCRVRKLRAAGQTPDIVLSTVF